MFNRTRNKTLDEFSKSLAKDLASRYEVGSESTALNKKAKRKLGAALDDIYIKAMDFQRENTLGIYGKARLGNTFKWELKEMGYEDEFIDEATKGLLVSLNKA
jgi:hypothetical protein